MLPLSMPRLHASATRWALLLLAILGVLPADAQRLPDTAIPEHYTLWFAPDLQTNSFRGTATIDLRLSRPSRTVILHAAELQISEAVFTSGRTAQPAVAAFNAAAETVTLSVPTPLPAGRIRLRLAFTGTLNDQLRGFYLSQANGRKYAVTQFEATDARRAFPCFDEPAFKATFDIAMTVDQKDVGISNGRLLSDTPGPAAGTHTLTFSRTPKMSTYLVAMLVGDFVCRSGGVGDTPIRVCATPDKQALTGFALEAAERSLAFFNDYFGIKYPFGKMDIIGIPDFSAGAMENAGAITFRESVLLADPARASATTLRNIASTMSHEIAHQWFGDLVTMQWWDDIWLNEGFATWAAGKPLQVWKPEWNETLFDVNDTITALATDSLPTTRAIRTHVETPAEINEVFDAIAYQKTAAVLRMVEQYVGEQPFRRAVSEYLRKYAYGNATGEQFWTTVAQLTGKPVDRIMASFVTQRGAPLVRVTTSCTGDATYLRLTQGGFPGVVGAPVSNATWTFPICARAVDGTPMACTILSRPTATIRVPGCGATPFVNAHSAGYFLTEYDQAAAKAFGTAAARLEVTERLGLLGDEWALVRAGRHDVSTYLELAGAFAGDSSASVVGEIAGRLAYAGGYLVTTGEAARFRTWVRTTFEPVLTAMGPGGPSEGDEAQRRRATLMRLVGLTGGSPAVQARARDLAVGYLANPASVPGTMVSTVLQVAAVGGDATLYDQYVARMNQMAANPEEYYRFLNALPFFADQALVDRTIALALAPELRSQDVAGLLGGLLGGKRAGTWTYMKANWPKFAAKLDPFQGMPGVVGALGGACTPEAAKELPAFFATHPVPSAERALQGAVSRIDSCATLAARQSPSMAAWLATLPAAK